MVVKCTKGIKSNQVARINILCVCGVVVKGEV